MNNHNPNSDPPLSHGPAGSTSNLSTSSSQGQQGRRPVIIRDHNQRAMLHKIRDSLAHLQPKGSLPSPGSDASGASGASTPKDGARKGESYNTAAMAKIKASLQTFRKDEGKPSDFEATAKVNVQELIQQMSDQSGAPISKFGGLVPSRTPSQKRTIPVVLTPENSTTIASSESDLVYTIDNEISPPPLPPRSRGLTTPPPPLPPRESGQPSGGLSRSAIQYQPVRRTNTNKENGTNSAGSTPRGMSPNPKAFINGLANASNAPTATPMSTLEQLADQTGYTTEQIQAIVMVHSRQMPPHSPSNSPLPSYNDKHITAPGNPPLPNYPRKPVMNGPMQPPPQLHQQLNPPPPPYVSPGNYMQSPASSVTSGGSGNDYVLMGHIPDYPNRVQTAYGESPSSGSSSPASVSSYQSQHYYAANPHKHPLHHGNHYQYPAHQPQPLTAWEAKQQAVITQSARSQQVSRPSLQTARLPANNNDPPPPSYKSSVHAQMATPLNNRPLQGHPGAMTNISAQSSNIASAHGGNVHIKLRNHQDPQLQVTGQPSFHVTASQQQGMPITLESSRPSQIQIQFSTPISQSHQANMDPRMHRKSSIEARSDSPVSRTMNQSPLSMVSTTSTSSDRLERPPPPYPGPSRTPGHHAIQTPDSSEVSETEQSETDSVAGQETTRCTSPIPRLKPEADKAKDDDRHWTRLRNYSPAAFKFYMEQHIENVLKQHKERISRRIQLENELAKVERLSEEGRQQMRVLLQQKETNYLRLKRAKMNRSMFEVIKKLGVGAFGEVTLVKKKHSDPTDDRPHAEQLYAMKTLRKVDVIRGNQVAHVKAERDMLAEANLEWVTKLYYSFQDKENLYFIMEYIPGGDLMALLIRLEIFDETLSRFYVAEMVLAIESVHKMGFIHRDIKPDNILIDANGHIKLTDFGLCTGFRWTHNSKYYQEGHNRQESMDISDSTDPISVPKELPKILENRKRKEKQRRTAHSLVGTPNYIAPEVLMRQGYTRSCDWWSVGVIMYEMLVGQPPFLANTPKETQIKVVNWEKYLHIPEGSNLSESAAQLIRQLCTSPDKRLGKSGADDIKGHPFFKPIDFNNIRKTKPPYKPKILYATDTSNFDEVEECGNHNPCKVDDLRQNGHYPEHAFSEFTYRRFFDDDGNNHLFNITESLSNDLRTISMNEGQRTDSSASRSTKQSNTNPQNDKTLQNSNYVEEETRAGNPVYV